MLRHWQHTNSIHDLYCLKMYYLCMLNTYDAYQFGFTSGCSTSLWFARDIWRYRNVFWLIDWLIDSLCTDVLKKTVDCYTQGGSHVFASFLDFSKAFDKVCYWKLFHKLLDDNINVSVIRVLVFWYIGNIAFCGLLDWNLTPDTAIQTCRYSRIRKSSWRSQVLIRWCYYFGRTGTTR